jgi:hypothetical protein
MRIRISALVAIIALAGALAACSQVDDEAAVIKGCAEIADLRPIAAERTERFLGKLDEGRARCWGGEAAVAQLGTPWIDWSNYWAAGDASSRSDRPDSRLRVTDRNKRGIDGALLNLEYQRMELIKLNLFDNRTFEQYLNGVDGQDGAALTTWKEMRLAPDHPSFRELAIAADGAQTCRGALVRHRTLTGICNDIRNPAMGATGQLFARNVEFESTFPDLGLDPYAKNRHGGRIGSLRPDPQVISRKLFTRAQKPDSGCNEGRGVPGSVTADCTYKKAPFFNVLAAFWIQFMTHDWFSHLEEGRNDTSRIMPSLGCASERVENVEQPMSPEAAARLGCRPGDKMEAALIADGSPPGSFKHRGAHGKEVERLRRAYKTTRNNVTAWWDASQIYGYDERSRRRVRRDPADQAKLAMTAGASGASDRYLPAFRPACGPQAPGDTCDPIQPEWGGQEAAAFPDNWSIGMSFYHNLFVREHNSIVDEFRKRTKEQPSADSGLRNPDRPAETIPYAKISDDELFEIARLIVAAEIAKIHTIEWTTQLLYDEPLFLAMNANWAGVLGDQPLASEVTRRIVKRLSTAADAKHGSQLYSALAAGAGIVGTGNSDRFPAFLPSWLSFLSHDRWQLTDDYINGGINHFGSPFNFPEEFVSVYRLHPLVPDLLELRDWRSDPNVIRAKVPVIDTFRGKATAQMQEHGLANWALTMGRQRLGALALRNHPQLLQNLDLRPRLDSKIDVAALDLIRDRERGIPRFNEFRRQIGLRQLTGFDDFIDRRPAVSAAGRAEQQALVDALREVYGTHRCEASKIITTAQRTTTGAPINDCLGHADGSMVDNIEDVDIVVGFLAETTRPHGFAISETQFHIFIINASRRLFSDRFFTSSFRPEFYGKLGIDWVMDNGPTGKHWEAGEPNGHRQEVSPLKRVLLRAMPELAGELAHVVNAFDPWARDRAEYYSLQWKPRGDAVSDPAFKQ